MPVFTKKSHNHFDVDHFEVDNSFGFRITVDGDYFAFAGMSLGDLVTINQHIAEAIRKGPIVRGIRTVLAAPFAVLAFALVTVAMFSARAAMWISAGYRGAVKVEAEL